MSDEWQLGHCQRTSALYGFDGYLHLIYLPRVADVINARL